MSEVCPYCERIVGKLHHACGFCHIHYCDDCISPDKHYCPSYREEDYKIVPSTNASPIISSKDACNDFAKKYTENEEEVPFITIRDIKRRVAEGNGTLDSYICPKCINVRDTDRYACIHCKTSRNIQCDWCGNHFCEACIKPERHDCLEYERELRKSSYIEPPEEFIISAIHAESPEELVNKNEQRPLIDTSSNERTTIAPEKSKPLIRTKDENSIDDGSKVEVKEELQSENKVSLWRKIFSKFGFSK